MLRWIGIADNVTLVSSTRPAPVSSPDFQVGILAAIASTNGCSSTRCSLFNDRGMRRDEYHYDAHSVVAKRDVSPLDKTM